MHKPRVTRVTSTDINRPRLPHFRKSLGIMNTYFQRPTWPTQMFTYLDKSAQIFTNLYTLLWHKMSEHVLSDNKSKDARDIERYQRFKRYNISECTAESTPHWKFWVIIQTGMLHARSCDTAHVNCLLPLLNFVHCINCTEVAWCTKKCFERTGWFCCFFFNCQCCCSSTICKTGYHGTVSPLAQCDRALLWTSDKPLTDYDFAKTKTRRCERLSEQSREQMLRDEEVLQRNNHAKATHVHFSCSKKN